MKEKTKEVELLGNFTPLTNSNDEQLVQAVEKVSKTLVKIQKLKPVPYKYSKPLIFNNILGFGLTSVGIIGLLIASLKVPSTPPPLNSPIGISILLSILTTSAGFILAALENMPIPFPRFLMRKKTRHRLELEDKQRSQEAIEQEEFVQKVEALIAKVSPSLELLSNRSMKYNYSINPITGELETNEKELSKTQQVKLEIIGKLYEA